MVSPFGTTVTAPQRNIAESEAQAVRVEAAPDIIRKLSSQYGVSAALASSIAYCESGVKQFESNGELVRGRSTPADVGIFQINERYHLEKSRELGFDIYTTRGNVEYGLWLLKKEGVQHWNASRYCWEK